MPRAPGGTGKVVEPDLEGAQSKGKLILLGLVVAVAVGIGGIYWYSSNHNAQTRAQDTRDSLRALGAAPAGPDTTRYAAPNDYSPIHRARALKAGLEGMLGNRAAVLGWAEGVYDTAATDRAEKRRAKQYADFVTRWHARLDALTRGGTEFRYAPGVAGYQFEDSTPWVSASILRLNYHVGVDGIAAGMLLVTALVGFAAVAVSSSIDSRSSRRNRIDALRRCTVSA